MARNVTAEALQARKAGRGGAAPSAALAVTRSPRRPLTSLVSHAPEPRAVWFLLSPWTRGFRNVLCGCLIGFQLAERNL